MTAERGTGDPGCRRLARRAATVAGIATAVGAAFVAAAYATPITAIWDRFDAWALRVALILALVAITAATIAVWAAVTRPNRRAAEAAAVGAVALMFPTAALLEAEPALPAGLRLAGAVVVASGLLIYVQIVTHLVGRVVVAVGNSWARRQGHASLDAALEAWLDPQPHLQRTAIAIAIAGAGWLFAFTFIPNGLPDATGIVGALADAGNRLLSIGDALAAGAITSAIVMWFQGATHTAPSTPPAAGGTNLPAAASDRPVAKSVLFAGAAMVAGVALSRTFDGRRKSVAGFPAKPHPFPAECCSRRPSARGAVQQGMGAGVRLGPHCR